MSVDFLEDFDCLMLTFLSSNDLRESTCLAVKINTIALPSPDAVCHALDKVDNFISNATSLIFILTMEVIVFAFSSI